MIEYRKPWRRQPKFRREWVGIAGTSLCGPATLALDGQPVVRVGTSTAVGTAPALAASFAAGTNMLRALIRGSAIGTTTGVGASLLAIFRTTSTATDGRIVSLGSDNGGGGNTLFSIGINASALRVSVGGSGSSASADSASVGANDGKLHCAVLTVDQFSVGTANFGAWFDGRRVITSSVGAVGILSLFNWIVFNGFRRGGTDSAGIAADVLLGVPFHRALADQEAQALSTVDGALDMLFQPRRIFVPQAAASGLPTLSAATYVPGSLTASGFRPRVTATY